MTPSQLIRLTGIFAQLSLERATESVSAWCERNVRFDEPKCKGPFSLAGREYLKEPLDNFANDEVSDQVCCMATRTGKTRIFYGGMAWVIRNEPSRILFVKPKTNGAAGARDDARTRFMPMIRATPALSDKIPGGQQRFDFNTAQQIINGTIIDWTGSNSVGALASNPCNCVIQDEVDKFNSTRRRDEDGKEVEADASDLADERAKEFSNPKRFKASTPTIEKGRVWQELLKSDFRRYFMPCHHCGKDVLFAWSKEYTLVEKTGKEAYVRWDSAARNADGSWDLDKVEATAHAECPHCQGRILDAHKGEMVRAGRWVATRKSNRRGYHLPAMYSAHRACNFGAMARRFLEAKRSLSGVQNFINSDLAEPKASQGQTVDRSTTIAVNIDTSETSPEKWLKILTVDYHRNSPYFWAVVRAWNGTDKSHGIAYRSFDSWDELDQLQEEFGVSPVGVGIDCRYMPKEVYRECGAFDRTTRCALEPAIQDQLPLCVGWTPLEGASGRYFWKDKTGLYHPWRTEYHDPFDGTELAYKCSMEVVKFRSDVFQDMLENVRLGRTGLQWTGSKELYDETYAKHMAGKKLNEDKNTWVETYSHAPDHIRDCEKMQVVMAMRLQLISFEAIQIKKREEKKDQ